MKCLLHKLYKHDDDDDVDDQQQQGLGYLPVQILIKIRELDSSVANPNGVSSFNLGDIA
jgi:hypothetical protein